MKIVHKMMKVNVLALLIMSVFALGLDEAQAANVLVVSGHPNIEQSIATKTIMEEVGHALPDAELVYLDKEYPDFHIDVNKERQRVQNADIIVMQYPIYWYTPPANMKQWQDAVFTYGFAHDANGGMLKSKKLILSMTSGAPADQYRTGARMNYPMETFQVPLKQFANLSGMDYAGMVYTGGYNLGRRTQERDQQIQMAKEHAKQLVERIREAESEKYININIEVNGQTLKGRLLDNATGRALAEKMPLTLPMANAHSIEMVHRFDQALPTDNVKKSSYEIGDLYYWTPRNAFVIYYDQNGGAFENLQRVGHIDGDVSLFKGLENAAVTFTKAAE